MGLSVLNVRLGIGTLLLALVAFTGGALALYRFLAGIGR